MVVRKARKDEVKVLQDLNNEIFVDNSKYDSDLKMGWPYSPEGEKYFRRILKNSQAICLIAEKSGKPIGYIVATPKEFGYRSSKYMEIENMGVTAKFRSKGVGVRLLSKCLNLAKRCGYQKAYVTSYWENIKAIKFYETNGFKKIDLSLEVEL